ncbi:dipeptide ABC transporter ATP-binding protein [Tenggerimyces flavus]|uniref:Dipeptide ABC transporter ATP-binding protein n=1 Tax=Tenggerimyces flavus TaxID=1708749 RepID=A0ABV7YHJ6_9ACTN|nr:ABC transporter ATP-binding protein [Tenggerimyces flavus]MBM7787983.1 peptide/nickel transport system ATP-binding protein [Tenggerimyces flavus]
MSSPVVSVRDLRVEFPGVVAVERLSFDLQPGAALGIVGESGSGKTATALALLGLHRGTSATVSGEIDVADVPVLSAPIEDIRKLRGSKISMIFQDPLSAFDPFFSVGNQIGEVFRLHTGASRRAARERAVAMLDRVRIPDAARRVDAYPHELSGGMRQRALIAMALACGPSVLVADEPTTALDVTVQAQILDLLDELRTDLGMALVLVTHDLGVVAGSVDEVLVMASGLAVERGPVSSVLSRPVEPYTRRLLAAVPRVDVPRAVVASGGEPVLSAVDVHRSFPSPRRLLGRGAPVRAVAGVSLDVRRGETLGVVGESGSGKTTLARMLVGLLRPSSGQVLLDGTDLASLSGAALRSRRRTVQMVFQDPASSLNPRRTVGDAIAEPLRVTGVSARAAAEQVRSLLHRVGLDPTRSEAYPHEFSGGQRQRVGLARALAASPSVLVCDEPVSSLDVTTQAQVLELLEELRAEFSLSVVFVSHDLAVVRQVSDRIAVMQRGVVVELGPSDAVYSAPADAYTRELLNAVPVLDPTLARQRRTERRLANVR